MEVSISGSRWQFGGMDGARVVDARGLQLPQLVQNMHP